MKSGLLGSEEDIDVQYVEWTMRHLVVVVRCYRILSDCIAGIF